MPDRDHPKIHATLAGLDVDAKPEPFRFGLPGGKVITFPDPGEMEWTEAEDFMEQVQAGSNRAMMQRWLSEDDYQKLLDARLTLRQMAALGKAVGKHYEDVFGGPGEDDASSPS